jgi:hypothetical protein
MSSQDSYTYRQLNLNSEEDPYQFPQLRSVPPELEVPELVIPLPDSRTPYTRAIPSVKPCYRTQHYARGTEQGAPYRISDKCSSDQSGAPWRQTPPQNPSQDTPPRKQWRRKRTVFSPEELAILTQYYEQHKFLNPILKAEILCKLDVPSNVLVMWFQNRRAKDRANGIII